MLFYETLGYIKKKLEGEENPNYTKGKKRLTKQRGKSASTPHFPPSSLRKSISIYQG